MLSRLVGFVTPPPESSFSKDITAESTNNRTETAATDHITDAAADDNTNNRTDAAADNTNFRTETAAAENTNNHTGADNTNNHITDANVPAISNADAIAHKDENVANASAETKDPHVAEVDAVAAPPAHNPPSIIGMYSYNSMNLHNF